MVYEGKFISYIAAKWNIEPGLFLWWEEKKFASEKWKIHMQYFQ